jgi:DNA-binding transcriptional ArsR family regulator
MADQTPPAPPGPEPSTTAPDRVLEVTDPHRLRALAHPLRLQLLRLIREHRPVTGARLAELTGESTASVSYHLSVLHRHGFVEPDPAPGPTRRHKPWRTTYESLRVVSEHHDVPPSDTVEGAILSPLLSETRRVQDEYLHGTSGLSGPWRDVGTFELTDLVLTEPEFDRLTDEVHAVITRFRSSAETDAERARFAVSFIAIPTAAPARSDSTAPTDGPSRTDGKTR